MPWKILSGSDIGGRDEQQDRYLTVSSSDATKHLLVVADGAGGHQMGGLAAQAAINYIKDNLASLWLSSDPESFISELAVECNKHVLAVGDGSLACTTLVLVFAREGELFWGHLGDSRFYLIRGGEVVFRTTDHSIDELKKQQAIDGLNSPIEASSNGLYMCLGALPDVVPEVASSVAREGDTLLLCSDGFWGQTNMKAMSTELSEQPLNNENMEKWVLKAKEFKSNNSDNIALVVAKYESKPNFFVRLHMVLMGFLK